MRKFFLFLSLVLLSFNGFAQDRLPQLDENFNKAKTHFVQKEYKQTLLYLELCKLSKITSKEVVTVLEIEALFYSMEHPKCLKLIDISLSSINMSLNSLNVISSIKLKIQDFNKKKRIEVEKLKMQDKVKNEASAWSSFLAKAKSSVKSIISN